MANCVTDSWLLLKPASQERETNKVHNRSELQLVLLLSRFDSIQSMLLSVEEAQPIDNGHGLH
jgi:hypothetical protein